MKKTLFILVFLFGPVLEIVKTVLLFPFFILFVWAYRHTRGF